MDEEREEQTPSDYIEEEFDGVETDADRGETLVDFNLPLNLDHISPATEFQATESLTRGIGALDFRPAESQVENIEFDMGATFQASPSMFAPNSVETRNSNDVAPSLPCYLRPALTSFKSGKSLSVLKIGLEESFSTQSVIFTNEESPCTYECSQLNLLSMIEFEVRIFSDGGKHLVEFRHLAGCRYGFSATYKSISQSFDNTASSSFVPMAFAPLSLSDDDELALPSLQRSPESVVDHEMSLMSEGTDVEFQVQGVRAVGSGLDNVDKSMFCEEGFGLPMANRVVDLASENTSDEGLRAVAMGTIAKLASLDEISNNWLNSTVNTVVKGVEDDQPHVRREAIRSLDTMAKRDSGLAAKFVRAGVVPLLEIEASGGADDQCKDLAAQAFAGSALKACRA